MSKLRTKLKHSHVESVNALFDQIYKAAPAGSDWLTALQQRALNKEAGWTADADSYIQGLIAAGAISVDTATIFRDNLKRCQGGISSSLNFLFPIIWIAVVAAVTVTHLTLANDTSIIAALAILAATGGGLWARSQPWVKHRNGSAQSCWKRLSQILIISGVSAFLTFLITFIVSDDIKRASIKQFNTDRASFMADPRGFPLLQKMAREQYGIEVVLGNANQSWVSTSMNLLGASAASMVLQPGYCYLSMRRTNVLHGFDPIGSVDSGLWVQGVMMHEFAHCLDGSRDMPAFGQKAIDTRSLAPVDAKKVKDLEGYLEAETHETTQLWREAVADTFAVGYWKLTAPTAAADLVDSLRNKRAYDADQDAVHATMCWIDYADRTDVPASTADLFEWADHLRTSAPCGQL